MIHCTCACVELSLRRAVEVRKINNKKAWQRQVIWPTSMRTNSRRCCKTYLIRDEISATRRKTGGKDRADIQGSTAAMHVLGGSGEPDEANNTSRARTGQRAARTGQRAARTGQRAARTGQRAARTGQRAARTGQRAARTGQRAARTGQKAARTGQRAAHSLPPTPPPPPPPPATATAKDIVIHELIN